MAAAAVVVLGLATATGCSTQTPEPSPATTAPTPTPTPSPSEPEATSSQAPASIDISGEIEALEAEFEARIGVAALNLDTGETVQYAESQRFGYASTIKTFVAAQMLRELSASERDATITWSADDVERAGYSPVTSAQVGEGMIVAELAEAAVRQSDNTATNLVLDQIGGPPGLADSFAELGDSVTDVVNEEPELNTIEPGSTADTTTALAFTTSLAAVLEPGYLPEPDRELLVQWMTGNATGDALIRAGAPEGWEVADKSGGAGPIRNNIALVTPADGGPIVVTILTEKNDASERFEDDVVARAAEIVLSVWD